MILSPCRNCPKRNQPKDKCIKNCELIKKLQDMQVSLNQKVETNIGPAVNYAEEGRFTINSSLSY
ncbi:MAG: hypothetical protein JW786_11735 [Desulfobacterales bacterium]|nr:hypothetical protein [Desulfobacterales bacterium]